MANKTLEITRFPLLGESVNGVNANLCLNLRRDDADGAMVLARPVAAAPDPSVIAVVNHHSAGLITFRLSGDGRSVTADKPGETASLVGTLSGEYLTAAEINDSLLAVSTTFGVELIEIDAEGGCRLAPRGHRLPMLRFEAFSEMTLSMAVEERQLKSSRTVRSSSLAKADADSLAADLLDAYSRLAFAAGASGGSLQPFLARYRMEDASGRLLFVSAPVMVTGIGGFQCMDELTTSLSDDGTRRNAFAVKGNLFSVRLVTAQNYHSAPYPEVHRLVVEATPPLHPVRYDMEAANALDREGTAGMRLRFFLPGASVTMTKARALARERLTAAFNHGELLFSRVAEVVDPFRDSTDVCVAVSPAKSSFLTASEQIKEVEGCFAKNVARIPRLHALASLPHRFSAAAAEVVGESVIWGNISTHRFAGYPLEHFSVVNSADETAAWRASVVTEMADGERRMVVSSAGTGHAPRLLSPVISYPAPDAVRMKIHLVSGSDNFELELPLTPSADGRHSFYATADCAPLALKPTDEPYTLPTSADRAERFASSLLSAAAASPLMPVDSARISQGSVVAVKSVDRRGASWDYSLRRAYIFSSEAILLANLTRKGEFASLHPADPRVVASAGDVVATTHDRYPLVALASGQLLGLTRGSVATLARLPYFHTSRSAAAMFWDGDNGELHTPDPLDDSLERVIPLGDNAPLQVDSDRPVEVKYSLTAPLAASGGSLLPCAPAAVSLRLEASEADLIAEVSCGAAVLSRLRLRGNLSGPLAFRIFSIPLPELTITLIGSAKSLRLSKITLQQRRN